MDKIRDTKINERPSSSISRDESQQNGNIPNSRQQQPEYEAKREEFRKYLEHSGVIEAMTKVLAMLYEETEKPDHPLEYVSKYFSGTNDEVQVLKKELEEAKQRINELEAKLLECDLAEQSDQSRSD